MEEPPKPIEPVTSELAVLENPREELDKFQGISLNTISASITANFGIMGDVCFAEENEFEAPLLIEP